MPARKKTTTKALATNEKVEQKFLDTFQGDADVADGFEGEDEDSGAIPRLKILQKLSPEADPDDGGFIKGAKPGMLVNSVTREIFPGQDNPIIVVPCYYEKKYNIWTPREEGGGLVASYNVAEGKALVEGLERNEKGVPITEDGNLVIDTREHYFLIIKEDGQYEAVVSSFASTKVKKSKAWFTMMKMARLPSRPTAPCPMYAFTYELRTVLEQSDQYKYYNWDIRKGEPITSRKDVEELAVTAKTFKDAILSGQRVAVPEDDSVVSDSDSSEVY